MTVTIVSALVLFLFMAYESFKLLAGKVFFFRTKLWSFLTILVVFSPSILYSLFLPDTLDSWRFGEITLLVGAVFVLFFIFIMAKAPPMITAGNITKDILRESLRKALTDNGIEFDEEDKPFYRGQRALFSMNIKNTDARILAGERFSNSLITFALVGCKDVPAFGKAMKDLESSLAGKKLGVRTTDGVCLIILALIPLSMVFLIYLLMAFFV